MISILCPSRGRPEQARKMAQSAIDMADGSVEILFYLNSDDPELPVYANMLPFHNAESRCLAIQGPDQPTTKSWNELAQHAKGDRLMVCGDDVEFKTKGWDTKLKAAAPEDGYAIMSVYDGRGEDSHPHPIFTRKIYEALGYVMWPGMIHWGPDIFAHRLGSRLGRHIYCRDILVEHQKPSDRGVIDDTHARIRNNWYYERDQQVMHSGAFDRALDAEVAYVKGLMA